MATKRTATAKKTHDASWGEPLVAFRLPQELLEQVDELAAHIEITEESTGRRIRFGNRSDAIRYALRFAVENHKEMGRFIIKRGPFPR